MKEIWGWNRSTLLKDFFLLVKSGHFCDSSQFLAFYTAHIERAIVPLRDERGKEVKITELMDKAEDQS